MATNMTRGAAARPWPLQPAGRIALLDVDPDLLVGGGVEDRATLRSELTVPVYRITSGAMPAPPRSSEDAQIGYLVLKGLLLYEVSVCGRVTAELLGPGDVIRPWAREDSGTVTVETKWTVLEQVLLADLRKLDGPRIANSSNVLVGLINRAADRAESAAIQRSIAAHVRVDVRVLAYLWHLAGRFGVVMPGAVRLSVPLTHAVIARLVGARRPTVTTALQRLMQLGYLRREGRAFLLVGDASAVSELESRSPARDFALPAAAVATVDGHP
jgi:CRP/FNR family cyclic AMP-dependent transcriptional regulator